MKPGVHYPGDGPLLEETLDALCAFHARHGHLRVPRDAKYGKPPRLLQSGIVTVRQRHARKELTPEQIKRMQAIGFPWQGANNQQWSTGIAYLREFQALHEHTAVPESELWGPDDFPLGAWRAAQTHRLAKGELPPEKAETLRELGVTGSLRDAKWELGFTAAQKYLAEHGHLRTPDQTYVTIGTTTVRLDTWKEVQRRNLAQNKCSTGPSPG